jgi:GH25 family lysozyme M1 (1,4-beta-N-acetylmuramidase)
MIQSSPLSLQGEVSITARANLRAGDASRQAAVIRTLEPGTVLRIDAIVVGEAVLGNAHWFRIDQSAFVWAGACGPLAPLGGSATPVPSQVDSAPVTMSGPGSRKVPIVVDLYHGDRVTSFTGARNAGVLGVIHKATTGTSGRDDAYPHRRSDALAAGLLWGAYHWGTAASAADQVDNFLAWAAPDDRTLIALDFERDAHSQMTLQRAGEFLTEIEQRLGRRAVLYSGSTIKGALGTTQDPFFGAHRLWLAQYGPTPRVQASWSRYWLWQYTDGTSGPGPRTAPGIPGDSLGRLDCDYFAGTAEQLAQEWAS